MEPKRKRGDRRDGRRLKTVHDFNGIFPYIMRGRNESIVFFSEVLDVENLLAYIERKKGTPGETSFFQVFVAAMVQTFRERPAMNRFIMGRRIYQRDAVDVCFVVKREFSDEGTETTMKVRFKEDDTFEDIKRKLVSDIRTAKSGEEKDDDAFISFLMSLPRFMIRAIARLLEWCDFYFGVPKDLENIDPLRCSIFLTNLGSIGIDAPYHHLYEWGTCSVFGAIGKIRNTPIALEDGSLVVRKAVEVKMSLDERIADGFYFARSLEVFRRYIANPELLEQEQEAPHAE